MSYPPPVYGGDNGEVTARFRSVDTPPDLPRPNGGAASYLATGASTGGKFGPARDAHASASEQASEANAHRGTPCDEGAGGVTRCGEPVLELDHDESRRWSASRSAPGLVTASLVPRSTSSTSVALARLASLAARGLEHDNIYVK